MFIEIVLNILVPVFMLQEFLVSCRLIIRVTVS